VYTGFLPKPVFYETEGETVVMAIFNTMELRKSIRGYADRAIEAAPVEQFRKLPHNKA
jgi:hypothetical protein